MKNVLIFYASYGGGHLSAAKSIKEYIDKNYTKDYKTYLIDCMEYINHSLNKLTTKAYADMAKKAPWAWGKVYSQSQKGPLAKISNTSNKLMSFKLDKLLLEIKPDIIVSTHPFASQMCAYLKKKGKITSKIATIMTDYAPHEQWLVLPEYIDYFFVSHEGMKNELNNRGISLSKIFSTGIPLSNRFLQSYDKEDILNSFNLLPNKKNILFFAGGEFGLGRQSTYEMLETLAKNFNDIQIIAISGRNPQMKKNFEKIVNDYNKQDSIKIIEYTNKVPELMSISDLVITKPGGLTTTESIASELPIVVINPIPGQEEENASFLEKNGLAIWIKNQDDIQKKLLNLLNNPYLLNKMKKQSKLFAKKNSCKNICEILLN